MALRKSQVLLPTIFQTTKNNKFLNATVDQLVSEPNLQRSEEHTSELQSQFRISYAVSCLKKKKIIFLK